MIAEVVGRAHLAVERRKHAQGVRATVAGVLKLFAQQHRNDIGAAAIAEFLNQPDAYPVADIEAALATLRSDGE
jgi:hypothetical protein